MRGDEIGVFVTARRELVMLGLGTPTPCPQQISSESNVLPRRAPERAFARMSWNVEPGREPCRPSSFTIKSP